MLLNYLKYIGVITEINKSEESEKGVYRPQKNKAVAQRYLDYLKEIDSYQKSRRATIENKNSQLVGQASVVTSIFSLFVPLLIGSFSGLSRWITIPFASLFVLVLIHYLLTILIAIKTLKINKYPYTTRGISTITKSNRPEAETDFLNQEISDLINCVSHNAPVDDRKGTNLIFATRNFEIANFGFALLTISIIVSTFFLKQNTPEILIKNPEEIRSVFPDSINTQINSIPQKDSIFVIIETNPTRKLENTETDLSEDVTKKKD